MPLGRTRSQTAPGERVVRYTICQFLKYSTVFIYWELYGNFSGGEGDFPWEKLFMRSKFSMGSGTFCLL